VEVKRKKRTERVRRVREKRGKWRRNKERKPLSVGVLSPGNRKKVSKRRGSK
jgi:hypothetical protein